MQLTVKDAAALINVSEKTIYRWVSQQAIPAYLVNTQYRFNRAELLEWATSRRIQVSADLLSEPESSRGSLPGFVEALEAGGIFYRIGGDDKESVLRIVVEHMRLPDEVDRQFLLRVLLARELLAPTGVGEGIAVPHVRNPVVLHVARPTVTLCFLEKAVDFGALDGQPVRVVFSLLSPTTRAHLHLLSRLGFALRDPGFRSAVLREGSREEILGEARRVESSFAPCVLADAAGVAKTLEDVIVKS
jgi:PTS system nitrogen regulatory IIA component